MKTLVRLFSMLGLFAGAMVLVPLRSAPYVAVGEEAFASPCEDKCTATKQACDSGCQKQQQECAARCPVQSPTNVDKCMAECSSRSVQCGAVCTAQDAACRVQCRVPLPKLPG
jgi:hypothetical protein